MDIAISAIDKALEKAGVIKPSPAPLTAEFLAERQNLGKTGKRKFPDEIFSDGKLTPYSSRMLSNVLPDGLAKLEDVNELARLQHEYAKALAGSEQFSTVAANNLFRSQKGKLAEALIAGQEIPKDIVTQSEAAISADYTSKRAAYIAAAQSATDAARNIAGPIIAKAEKAIADFMAKLEADERAEADRVGVPFHPSNLWKACAAALLRLTQDRVRAKGLVSPASMVEGIVTL